MNVSKAFFSTNKKMKLIAPMWFKRKVLRNRAGVVRRLKVVGGKKVEFEGFVDPWPDASRKFLSIVLCLPILRCCTMANTYQFQRIFLLAVLMANSFRLTSAMFEQPDSQSKEQMDATPTCFRRPYTFKVYQEDSEGRSCWDVVTVTSCWGRCSSNEVKFHTYLIEFDVNLCFICRLQIGASRSNVHNIPSVNTTRSCPELSP